MAAATSSSAPKLALVQGRSPLALVHKVESLNTELGLTSSAVSIPSAVEAIAAMLGMAEAIKGKPLVEQVNACYAAVFSTNGVDPVATTVVTGTFVGSEVASNLGPVVMRSDLDGQSLDPQTAPASGRDFTFSACSDKAFDTNGVLYALGTDYGRASHRNPADSGKVRLGWSADAANYYSTAGGHKRGDAKQAARVICAHTHAGANATMWSRGAAGA